MTRNGRPVRGSSWGQRAGHYAWKADRKPSGCSIKAEYESGTRSATQERRALDNSQGMKREKSFTKQKIPEVDYRGRARTHNLTPPSA